MKKKQLSDRIDYDENNKSSRRRRQKIFLVEVTCRDKGEKEGIRQIIRWWWLVGSEEEKNES